MPHSSVNLASLRDKILKRSGEKMMPTAISALFDRMRTRNHAKLTLAKFQDVEADLAEYCIFDLGDVLNSIWLDVGGMYIESKGGLGSREELCDP